MGLVFFRICFAVFILLGVFGACNSSSKTKIHSNIQTGRVYGESSSQDIREIRAALLLVINSLETENFLEISNLIHEKEGIWIDLKAKWTRQQFLKDAEDSNGYLHTYFLNTDNLKKKRNSSQAISVRDVLRESGGLIVDYYFETFEECELDLHFVSGNRLESHLINPIFRKIDGKWYLVRFF
jgi:hypothetical protein